MKKYWTVKEVCELTGLTGKHLYYFHHEGVARAAKYSNYSVEDRDGYKLYDDAGVAKLQQIAMYYELGLKRNEIRDLMKAPNYDMHRALDELQDRLEEKQIRLSRHICAIKDLRQIGTKNGLLDLFSGISLEDLGRNSLAFSESALKDCWENAVNEECFETFLSEVEDLLQELARNEGRANKQKEIVKRLTATSIRNLGFPGYMFIVGLFLTAVGEGETAEEIADNLPIRLTPTQGKVAMEFLKEDMEMLLNEIAHVIAQHHKCIGDQFDAPTVLDMVAEAKEVLFNHVGIKEKEEYAVVLDALVTEEGKQNPDYLQYLINAMKYHLKNSFEVFPENG